MGRRLAADGKRRLLLEVDPRESLYPLLGVEPSGGEIVAADHGLHVQNVQPRDVLDALVAERLRVGVLTRRVLRSPIYQHFVDGCPGLKEMAVLGHAYTRLRDREFDQIVLDAPATGHGLALLTAPGLVWPALADGPIRALSREVADFVDEPSKVGIVVVTLAEEMPVQETEELAEQMRVRLNREAELLVVNGLIPQVGQPDRLPPPLQLAARRAAGQQAWRRRLSERFDRPRCELPLLPIPASPRLVDLLSDRLDLESR